MAYVDPEQLERSVLQNRDSSEAEEWLEEEIKTLSESLQSEQERLQMQLDRVKKIQRAIDCRQVALNALHRTQEE